MNSVSTSSPAIILPTKLYRPSNDHDLIQRPRLIEHLNQGLARKLTLITAPAGYGKTTIATQWLTQLSEMYPQAAPDVAWLSLDQYDDDLLSFLRYFLAAVQTINSDFVSDIVGSIERGQPQPWQRLADWLVSDLARLSKPLFLTLDDFHTLTQKSIYQFVDRLLDHLPPLFHLVLLSRTEPPLALGRLRVNRQVSELRAVDLSFSLAETTQFLTKSLNNLPPTEIVHALQESSEGWVAGVQLAALSLSQRPESVHRRSENARIQHVQGRNPYVIDYLFEEVLTLQPRAVQEFLLQTSILKRFCVPLCEAILGSTWLDQVAQDDQLPDTTALGSAPAQTLIRWLVRANLFLIPLDNDTKWYRYHHLFQEMLVRTLTERMSAADVAALHRRASRWLANEGVVDEALRHALAADEISLAIQLVIQHRHHLLAQFDYHTLERWLELLPERAIEQSPVLLLLQCWIAVSSHSMSSARASRLVQQVEAHLEKPDLSLDENDLAVLRAEITAVKGGIWFFRHDFPKALSYLLPALEDLPLSYVFVRVHTILFAMLALQGAGQTAEAIALFEKEAQNVAARSSLPMAWLRSYLPVFDYLLGDLRQAVQSAQYIVNRIEIQSNHNAFLTAVPYRWLGTIYYEWNELDRARRDFLSAAQSNTVAYYNSQLGLAWIREVQGQHEQARQIVEELLRRTQPLNSSKMRAEIAAFQARCLNWRGDTDLALRRMRTIKIVELEQGHYSNTEVPAFTLIKILIDQGGESNWQEAEGLLKTVWSGAAKAHSIPGQVKILALRALLRQKQGRFDEAFAELKRSVGLAKPGGFIRTFVDQGAPMAQLLQQLVAGDFEPEYLHQILIAFPTPQLQSHQRVPAQPHQSPVTVQSTKLVEPITRRELEVLILLADRLTNKEIAESLTISPYTVKNHVSTIYRKLDVAGRREAVTKANALGLLP